jgi:protein kinase A
MSELSTAERSKKVKYQLGDLNVLRTLGTGSFGRVHLVQLKSSKQYCAMKVMRKSEVVRLKQVEHTLNEKSILEQIECPFTVNLLGSFQDSQNLYFVLEYVAGGELFSLLRRSQVLYCAI